MTICAEIGLVRGMASVSSPRLGLSGIRTETLKQFLKDCLEMEDYQAATVISNELASRHPADTACSDHSDQPGARAG